MVVETKYEFGFGFLNFLYTNAEGQEIAFDQYLEEISKTLIGLSGVSDFKMSYQFRPWEVQLLPIKVPDVENGEMPFPDMEQTALSVQFRLNIPRSEQEKLIDAEIFNVKSENFLVVYFCGFSGPSVFVFTLDAPRSGSHGIAVVREFLLKALSESEHLRLQIVGPTPFPRDCLLVPGDDIGIGFAWTCKEQSGYDEIRYVYDRDAYVDDDELIYDFTRELGEEVAQYFGILRWNRRIEIQWSELETRILNLAVGLQDRNFKSKTKSLFRYGKDASILGLDLAVLEAQTIKEDAEMTVIFREAQGQDLISMLEVTREIQTDRIAATPKQLEKVLSIVDATQSKRWNAIWPVIAALLGAIVGSHLI